MNLLANISRLTIAAALLLFTYSSICTAETPVAPVNKPAEGKVRIAIVQQNTIPGDVQANRDKAIQFAKYALAKNPDIILFHEALTVGYVKNIHDLAEKVDGPTTQSFQKVLADQKSDALILYGLIEKDGDDYYTSATLVGRKGVVANYRKTHLWWKDSGLRHEPTFFKPGNELVTFDLKGHKCGVMICYDGDFPEMTRAYANKDCTMLFWLNNRDSRGHKEVRQHASRSSMIMATSCVCGDNEVGNHCGGGSNITDKDGKLLKEIWDNEGIIYADVEPASVLEARKKNPWYKGRRSDLYQ
ncbi:MAG: carbon-nitrogen hydrolase family protein [Planctomycetota bacterium]|nr:carbon-nitrogen hydrolase family protein [Planctomycetota bacterium]